jgi:hypothetical protein
MEIGKFTTLEITKPFYHGTEKVEITFNADAFTPEFYRLLAKTFREKLRKAIAADKAEAAKAAPTKALAEAKSKRGQSRSKAASQPKPTETTLDIGKPFEETALYMEVEREIYATFLADGILLAWDVWNHGEPVAVSKAALMRLHPHTVKHLYDFCSEFSTPVKKREIAEMQASQTISGATDAG